MWQPWRRMLIRLRVRIWPHPGEPHFSPRRPRSTNAAGGLEFSQAQPLGPYYAAILSAPSPSSSQSSPSSSSPLPTPPPLSPPSDPSPQTRPQKAQTRSILAPPEDLTPSPPSSPVHIPAAESRSSPTPTSTTATTAEEKARIIFGTRLAGPERLAASLADATLVAGVLVPRRPEEPDNCCMSGCVNCVWERFREEMDEWAAANAEAHKRLAAKGEDMAEAGGKSDGVDDSGLEDEVDEETLYRDVPVGIREFMKHEKRLKEKSERENRQIQSS